MPASRTPAQQATARANGDRSAQNGTRHGLCGGPFALLPDEDRGEFAALHAAVTSDWGPRDAYERRWVMELVASMWRQDRLRGLELATLEAAAAETPPGEATVKKLATFARYGARIDKDIGHALQALRVLRDRPDDWLDELQDGTPEPAELGPQQQARTIGRSPGTREPKRSGPHVEECTDELPACTPEPAPAPALSRQQRRRLEALARKRRAA